MCAIARAVYQWHRGRNAEDLEPALCNRRVDCYFYNLGTVVHSFFVEVWLRLQANKLFARVVFHHTNTFTPSRQPPFTCLISDTFSTCLPFGDQKGMFS